MHRHVAEVINGAAAPLRSEIAAPAGEVIHSDPIRLTVLNQYFTPFDLALSSKYRTGCALSNLPASSDSVSAEANRSSVSA